MAYKYSEDIEGENRQANKQDWDHNFLESYNREEEALAAASNAVSQVAIVADQAAMLALAAKVGWVAKRTDNKGVYKLSALPATTLGNWVYLGQYDITGIINPITDAVNDLASSKQAVEEKDSANGYMGLNGDAEANPDQLVKILDDTATSSTTRTWSVDKIKDKISATGTYSEIIVFNRSFLSNTVNHVIDSAIDFDADFTNAVPGAVVLLRLVADGVNEPTFAGIEKIDGFSFNNTDGVVNYLAFFYDGISAYVNCFQKLGDGVPDGPDRLVTPASFTATAISDTEIELTWGDVANEIEYELQRSADGLTGWSTIASPAINEISYINTGLVASTQYYYRLRAISDGVSYLNSLYTSVVNATTDGVAPELTIIEFTTRSNLTKTGDTYTQTTPVAAYTGNGLSDRKIATGTDGYYQIDITSLSANGDSIIGFKTTNAAGNYNTGNYNFFVWANSAGNYFTGTNGGGVTNSTIAANSGDILRLKRTAGVITAEYYRGGSWNIIRTFGDTETGDLFMLANTYNTAVCLNPRALNHVAV